MSSAVEICNLALSHLGSSGIDALDERSEAAAACTTFYAICRDMVLRDAPWPFATKMQALALVEEDPNTEWGFSYRYPSDCPSISVGFKAGKETTIDRAEYRISSEVTMLVSWYLRTWKTRLLNTEPGSQTRSASRSISF